MRDGFIQAEYLQLTGNEYIDTWFKPNTNSKITIDCQIIDATFSSYTSVFGARNNNTNQFFIFTDKTTSGTEKWSARWCNTSTDYTINTSFTTRHTISLDKSTFIIDNKSATIPGTTFTSAYTLYLGGANNAGVLQYPSKVKIYSCKIYDNGTLIRDFVPCLEDNESGNIGLYDLVNNNFYRPCGTGNPILNINKPIIGNIYANGSKAIERGYVNVGGTYKPITSSYIFKKNSYNGVGYIESNGLQKIDTGVAPSDDLVVTIDFQCMSDGITENAIFGSSWATNGFFLSAYKDGGGLRWHYGGSYKDVTIDATTRHTVTCSKTSIVVDGTTHSISSTGTNTTNNINLFSTPDVDSIRGSSLTYNGRYRLYSCKFIKNGVTIRDFIPARNYPDNITGLYDKINHKFYCNDYSEKDKISYNKRSCIKTTYPENNGILNAKWTYSSNTEYAGYAKVLMNNSGKITGTTYIPMKPNETDAIKFTKYGYDNGYVEPYTNLKSSDCTFVSLKIIDSYNTEIPTTNPTITVNDDHIMNFSVQAPWLISALPENYTIVITVTRSSVNCSMTIPITKINIIGRYFVSNRDDEYWLNDTITKYMALYKYMFSQSTYAFANGRHKSNYLSTYIHLTRIYPIPSYMKNVTIRVGATFNLGSNSGFYWYDARGNFISGNIATYISGNTMSNIAPDNARYFCLTIHNSDGITPDTIGEDDFDSVSLMFISDSIEPEYSTSSPNGPDLCPIYDVRTITSKSYTPEPLVPTWTITSKVSGASYGFNLASDGYYTSSNNGVNNSASVCRVNFTNNTGAAYTVTFNCINYAESNYDFGIIGKINTALSTSYDADSTYTKSFKGSSSSGVQTVTLSVPTGSSWVDIKYRKDSSQHSNNDSLKFKIVV